MLVSTACYDAALIEHLAILVFLGEWCMNKKSGHDSNKMQNGWPNYCKTKLLRVSSPELCLLGAI